ncbi:CocE/NonD family hydrolase [Nakamurella sp. YIM 132087]|uniref:CocE/NonD family hydrolase n=1 Tax=Nakamurella alba TaxID=2665158 RepID=A0A7K1FQH1_9ACTN|nr:CocE/NonD family hydrolase [Nakamurella alba]MTD16395.1 CocE/NonD family hydrolase [Nakamurella alba]
MTPTVAGIERGQRRLNGPQTSGREYRNLSEPAFRTVRTDDVPIELRDGVTLLGDVYRPDADAPVPALVSFSAYPRQIQDLGAPLGFIEAGATDFFVPRGYAQVIVNARGTSGSEGTWSMLDEQEGRDVYDVVEWLAAQPWCDGNVGMLGISYFAMAQLAGAARRPPHLKAIFPLAASHDMYEAVWHNGLLSANFVSGWMPAVGVLAQRPGSFWHSRRIDLARHALNAAPVHRRMAHIDGESIVTVLQKVIRSQAPQQPYGQLWDAAAVDHPVRDEFWDARDTTAALAGLDIPVYLGCDLENVPLHLPGTYRMWKLLRHNPDVRMSLLAPGGLSWPWESMHIEALAWYDHWLRGADTGIMDGPAVRYFLPGADRWRTAESWPPAESSLRPLALRGDGVLGDDEGVAGVSESQYLPADLDAARPKNLQPNGLPDQLDWEIEATDVPIDIVGDVELRVDAVTGGGDLAWIAMLSDVAPDGSVTRVTAGWLRAELRAVDEALSVDGAPVLPCRTVLAVPAGEVVTYRIPLVPIAHRIRPGHRLRLTIAHDDRGENGPTVMGFTHAPVGGRSHTRVLSSSRLLLPVLPAGASEA